MDQLILKTTNKNTPKPKASHFRGKSIGSLVIFCAPKYEKRSYARTIWWYWTICSCGGIEEMHADQLRKRTDCKECVELRRIESLKQAAKREKIEKEGGIPNFATMRLRK